MKKMIYLGLMCALNAHAADPANGTVSSANPQLTWTGGTLIPTAAATCNGPDDPACDHFAMTIDAPSGDFKVEILVTAAVIDDYDLEVYDPQGQLVASSGSSGTNEKIELVNPVSGVWTVSAANYAAVGEYDAVANLSFIDNGGGGQVSLSQHHFINYGPPGAEGNGTDIYGPVAGENGVGLGAGEPTLGVPVVLNEAEQVLTPNISRSMYISGLETLQVSYDDSTFPAVAEWVDRSVATHVTTLDPILETDPMTGRTFSSQLAGKLNNMSFSDDNGLTWTLSQGNGINSGVDHQTVGSGVFSDNDPIGPITSYPNAVYYASQDIAVAQLSLSRDGGLTFGAAVPMYNLTECGGLHGHIEVARNDGTVYVPNKNCGSEQGVARSDDSGTTWMVRTVPGTTSGSSDPSAAAALDGTLYLGMCSNDSAPMAAVSSDKGDSWSTPTNVGAPFDIVNCAFPEMIAGDGDRAAFAFLGSATPGAGTSANPDYDGVWHMYVSFTYDGGQTWETNIVTPGDPVQRGAVCLSGTTCESGRNLLDFNDIELDEKGRVLIGYADGCVSGCVDSGNNSGTDIARIARQQKGTKGLLSAFDDYMAPSTPTAPDTPYAKALNFGESNEVQWKEPFNGGAEITSYMVFRRTETGQYTNPSMTVPGTETHYSDPVPMGGENYCYKVIAVNSAGTSASEYETCAEAPEVVNACELPGAKRGQDDTGEQAGGSQLDVQDLFLAEPFIGDPMDCQVASEKKLIFNMTIGDPLTKAAGNAWIILWNRANPVPTDDGLQTYDRNMVNMRWTGTGPECHYGMVTAPSVNQGDDLMTLAPEDCVLKDNGEMTIRISTADIDDCDGGCEIGPGYSLDGLEVRTFNNNVSGQPISQATASDFANALSYQLVGNESCRLDAEPIANTDVGESSARALIIPVLANDVAGDCDQLTVTSVGQGEYGEVTISANGQDVIYTPTSSIIGEDVFNYEVTDSSGNSSSASITIIQNSDILFWDGFNQ